MSNIAVQKIYRDDCVCYTVKVHGEYVTRHIQGTYSGRTPETWPSFQGRRF